jgi:hypothetical protein
VTTCHKSIFSKNSNIFFLFSISFVSASTRFFFTLISVPTRNKISPEGNFVSRTEKCVKISSRRPFTLSMELFYENLFHIVKSKLPLDSFIKAIITLNTQTHPSNRNKSLKIGSKFFIIFFSALTKLSRLLGNSNPFQK